ncbi:hypothetical protein HDE_11198 [Halotydeus destructor]|nr:hypothetical protein HDE_11198 [Halotydeus destructor]
MIRRNGQCWKYFMMTVATDVEDEARPRRPDMKRFCDAIGTGCPKLERLHFELPDSPPLKFKPLKSLLIKIGPQLTALGVNCHLLNEDLLEVITGSCKNLEYLSLVLEAKNGASIETVRDKLKPQLRDLKLLNVDFV